MTLDASPKQQNEGEALKNEKTTKYRRSKKKYAANRRGKHRALHYGKTRAEKNCRD